MIIAATCSLFFVEASAGFLFLKIEFINIQVGDVIPLDSYVNSDFKVQVGELTKFYAKPGVNKGKNAIQITSIIRKGE